MIAIITVLYGSERWALKIRVTSETKSLRSVGLCTRIHQINNEITVNNSHFNAILDMANEHRARSDGHVETMMSRKDVNQNIEILPDRNAKLLKRDKTMQPEQELTA